jgi:hypothetical protein
MVSRVSSEFHPKGMFVSLDMQFSSGDLIRFFAFNFEIEVCVRKKARKTCISICLYYPYKSLHPVQIRIQFFREENFASKFALVAFFCHKGSKARTQANLLVFIPVLLHVWKLYYFRGYCYDFK